MQEKDLLLSSFRKMSRIRQFDNWIHTHIDSPGSPLMGLMHSHIGEEGYSVAVINQLDNEDYISTTYRNHAHSIARGVELKSIAAEICGRITGCCKGRAGNMHAVDQDLNIIAGFGIIGAGLPSTLGTAFASRYRSTNQISVAFFGDGAVPQGTFHESMNLAKVFNLPVLFVNNNNHYAMSTPAENNLVNGSSLSYASGYNMARAHADGMDYFEAYSAAKKGIDFVRSGNGPYFLEFDCYRFHGQWEGDEQKYKPESQVKEYWERDPIKQFKDKVLLEGLLYSDEINNIEDEVAKEVEEAFEYARNSDFPKISDITTDVYADRY